jgi:hypothetical protein
MRILMLALLLAGGLFATTSGPKLNTYDLLLTVGTDEPLTTSAVHVGTQGFVEYLGLTQAQIDSFQASAVAWYEERFGIDFTGAINVGNNVIVGSNFVVAPIYFDANYRVLSSNNIRINSFPDQHPAKVRLAEFVLSFNSGAEVVYNGTYGTNIPGEDTDTLAYGCYVVTAYEYLFNDKYRFFMRSYYPNHTIKGTTRSNENFQMHSPEFGPGYGFLNVAVPTAPDASGKFQTYTRASWSFLGSFTQPDFNGFTIAPL